ncbi:DNA-3-methyladenine glycosylase [Stenotrophomonas indicatrix]|uniref:DNA-3-methyladenine glycosylase n=1 Tax=Stenotrophomonas indicatrix TaxID=2045451 RepID=UPI00047002AC|nr:DNA-3-methyladenine glycosylase [Stenotrophomonas indicatrix]
MMDWLPDTWIPIPRTFYRRPSTVVAPDLLNKLLVRSDGRAARIVEVEAYAGSEDPAAHSYRGRTARNASMFGEAGHLYVYFTYGMHWGRNVVCGEVGEGVAVLLRAAEPVAGQERMYPLRPAARHDHDLASGPGKLSQAFGLDRRVDGADLVTASHGITLVDDGTRPPDDPVVGPRIGITRAVDFPWRWHVRDHRHVSVRPARASTRRSPR